MKELSRVSVSFRIKDGKMLFRPRIIKETLDLMRKYPDYYLRQGGTGTYKKFENVSMDKVIDISGVWELKKMYIGDGQLVVGAGVTFTDLLNFLSDLADPVSVISELRRVISKLASPQVSMDMDQYFVYVQEGVLS